MKNFASKIIPAIFFAVFLLGFANGKTYAQNSISGMIFDQDRKPVSDIEVELLDSLERLIASRKTRGGGFYTFQRLNQGIYYIRVRVAGTNFREQSIRVDLGDLNAIGGVDVKQVDVYLEVDSGKSNQPAVRNEVIFAQNIPEEAKKSYEKGLENLDKNQLEAATEKFQKAILIFPDYFDALESLGQAYLDQNKYVEAENVFKRAFEVNPKSLNSLFGLAVVQNKLNKKNEALESLTRANELDATSINVNLLLGIIQRELKNFEESEKSLLAAKKLSKNQVADVHWNLALLYFYNFKRYNTAANELELYLKALPKAKTPEEKEKKDQIRKLIEDFREKAKQTS